MLRGRPLPRTHGGYVHIFGEIYVVGGEARKNIIRDLMKGLEAGSKARYEPDCTPGPEELELLERLYHELSGLLASSLREG